MECSNGLCSTLCITNITKLVKNQSKPGLKKRLHWPYDRQWLLAGDLTLTNIPNSMCTLVIRKYVNNIYNSSIFYNVVYFSFKETVLVLFLSLYLSSFGSGLVLV